MPMVRTGVIVMAAVVGVAAAGVLLGFVIPAADGQVGPGAAIGAAVGCALLAAAIGVVLTKKTPPD
jgi:hypothetical protein